MLKRFKELWKNKFNYSGTAGTKDFFLSLIANTIGMYVIFIPFLFLCFAVLLLIKNTGASSSTIITASCVLVGLYIAIFTIPILSLTVRRMRDSGIAWWLLILIIIVLPVIGFLIVGILKKRERKLCILTKIGWVLLLGGLGFALWQIPLTALTDYPCFETFAPYGLISMGIGLILGYIGTKIDDKLNA